MRFRNAFVKEPPFDRARRLDRGLKRRFGLLTGEMSTVVLMMRVRQFVESTLKVLSSLWVKSNEHIDMLTHGVGRRLGRCQRSRNAELGPAYVHLDVSRMVVKTPRLGSITIDINHEENILEYFSHDVMHIFRCPSDRYVLRQKPAFHCREETSSTNNTARLILFPLGSVSAI